MLSKTHIFSTLLSTLALAGPVHAQATAPAQGPAAQSSPAAEGGIPTMPDVKDAMLEPVPPAASTLASWRDAIRHVHQRSTNLHIAEAQVEQAAGVARSALAPALPQLSTTGTLSRQLLLGTGNNFTPQGIQTNVSIPDPATTFNASLDLSQSVFNLPVWYAIKTAKLRERGLALTEKDVERVLLAAVAQDAVVVITNERIAESNRVSLASALSTADLTRRRAALGAANAVDVLRAEADVSTSRAQVVAGDETLRRARETLGLDLGFTGQVGVAPEIRVEELQQTASQICKPVDSVDARADVRAATKTLEVANRDRTSVDYQFAPTVNLVSSLGYSSTALRTPNAEHVTWTAGAVAKWNIFDGGDRYGQQRQKEAALTIAREQLTQTQRAAQLQVMQAERNILVARATLDVSAKTRDIAKERARLSKIAFMNGSGTSFDLVDSAKTLREAEIDFLNKQFGVFQAEIAAFLAKADCSI